jgi:predicted enzyme related to lactoylglutathione lyase
MTSRLLAVTFDAHNPDRLARFWAGLLDRDVLADADGVLLPGDDTRAVGVFWAEALGWPLVWDENEETAVQSPHGGTKVAGGGPPVAPLTVPARQWFELLPEDDPDAEVERLVSLGARPVSEGDDGPVVLADPDGNEFRLRTGRPAA